MARILVVDDSPTVERFVRNALRGEGHEIQGLNSFIELPGIIAENPPDLVLLDLSIPAMSGRNMGSFIRRYERRHIPILIFSSQPEEELRDAAKATDAVGYVSKGAPIEHLRASIASALSDKGFRPSARQL